MAALFGLTTRTLRHWDPLGVVSPTWRSYATHRLYSEEDCQRIAYVLICRATGMSLQEIATVLDSPDSAHEHLHRQRELLTAEASRLTQQLAAVETLLEEIMHPHNILTPDHGAHSLSSGDVAAYAEEAEVAWGHTEAWTQSQHATADGGATEWQHVLEHMADLERRLATAFQSGVAADDPQLAELIEEHRRQVEQFYPVSYERHVLLGRSYVSDARFQAHYDAAAPGLTQWLSAAIEAHAVRHGVDLSDLQWERTG